MGFTVSEILETLARGENLSEDMARQGFSLLMDGELTPGQSGAFLMGLRAKGETAAEMAVAVNTALERAKMVTGVTGKRIDSVGTGGDGSCSFNCSTTVGLYLAAMGYQVVKHGNRAISSKCGSADAVEGLGLPMHSDPGDVAAEVAKRNFAFMFAPHFHPAFKHIMPVRKDLGIRTLFNIMGPLINPARPTHMLLGVAIPEVQEFVAEVLMLTGVERAAVVHGAGGLDELTPFGPATVVWLSDGKLATTHLDPAELGIKSCAPEDVKVQGPEDALKAVKDLLHGKGPEGMREMLILNLAVAIHLLEDGLGLGECVDKARGAVNSGIGAKVVE